MNESEQTCPFCKSQIDPQAVVCPQCNAVKGFKTRNGMRSKAYVMAYAVLLGAVSVFICVLMVQLSPAAPLMWGMAVMALTSAFGGFVTFREASSGPHWYKGT
ncbi:hypothetical protein [Yoonia sp. 2307UL14-13]|uniref:hypothetical protein n=1 Tax=Yoonia sp. 2307UL14-13 TaxID=3126506 RepID=UPI0030AE61AD